MLKTRKNGQCWKKCDVGGNAKMPNREPNNLCGFGFITWCQQKDCPHLISNSLSQFQQSLTFWLLNHVCLKMASGVTLMSFPSQNTFWQIKIVVDKHSQWHNCLFVIGKVICSNVSPVLHMGQMEIKTECVKDLSPHWHQMNVTERHWNLASMFCVHLFWSHLEHNFVVNFSLSLKVSKMDVCSLQFCDSASQNNEKSLMVELERGFHFWRQDTFCQLNVWQIPEAKSEPL